MLPADQNYETKNTEQLAIVETFKTWPHYFEGVAYTILDLTDQKNPKKFIETTRPISK